LKIWRDDPPAPQGVKSFPVRVSEDDLEIDYRATFHHSETMTAKVLIWVMILVIAAFAWWIYMQLAPMD
jgi:hypothetical protein